jgi:hypothetical protein
MEVPAVENCSGEGRRTLIVASKTCITRDEGVCFRLKEMAKRKQGRGTVRSTARVTLAPRNGGILLSATWAISRRNQRQLG